jgi:hypothetical protein
VHRRFESCRFRVSEAQKWRDSIVLACQDGIEELSDAGHDPHTIDSVRTEHGKVLWTEFRDGSAVFAIFEIDHTGLRDDDEGSTL